MKKRWLILIGIVAFVLVLGVGAAAGGAVAFFFLRDDGPAAFAASPLKAPKAGTIGVLISEVKEGGPADEAGLERGDILLRVGDQDVNNLGELLKSLQAFDPGDEVALAVLHGDDEVTLTATLGDRDGNAFLGVLTCVGPAKGGFETDTLPYDFKREIEIRRGVGVQIVEVVENSPAEDAGIQVDDIVLAVDEEKIVFGGSLADLIQSHTPGERVELKISRDGDEMGLEVELGENPEKKGQAYLGVTYQMAGPGLMFDFEDEDDFLFLPHHDFEGEFPFGDVPFYEEDMPGLHRYDQLPKGYESALIVGKVLEGSPAEAAGLQMDDLILELDGAFVEDVDRFVDEVGSHDPGDQIDLVVYRDGEAKDVTIELGTHPDDAGKGYLGVMVAGFVKITIEGDFPEDFDFELEEDLNLPDSDA